MTDGDITIVAGIEIPSTNPVFLTVVGIHVLLGLACTITGILAMLSRKRAGRHPRYGTIYFWCLGGVFLTASSLAAVRWAHDYHLFILGALSFAAAYFGRRAMQQRWRYWIRLHIAGMGSCALLWHPLARQPAPPQGSHFWSPQPYFDNSRITVDNATDAGEDAVMKIDDAAAHLEALGNPTRLKIYRALIRAGGAGLAVGRLQEKLKIAPSTLSHHIKALVVVGLVTQVRDATTLICHANYEVMRELVGFLVAECCTESAETKEAKTAA